MHLIPSFVLTAVLIVSRKYDLVGAIAFFVAGTGYIIADLVHNWPAPHIVRWFDIAALPIFIGVCFFVYRRRTRKIK